MAASTVLRTTELRAIHALIGECRELGDDAAIWRAHFCGRSARLAGAEFVMIGEMGFRGGRPAVYRSDAEVGWENGFNRPAFDQLLDTFRTRGFGLNPLFTAYFAAASGAEGDARTRAELVPDRDWYGSAWYADVQQPTGADATLYCYRGIPGEADTLNYLTLVRPAGERDFSPRQRTAVREAHALLAPLLTGVLARPHEPSPSDLPPRVRQVLQCLLGADSDKQIASRLGISQHTVNQYVKQIFVHFAVQSRSELLARWVRRAWGRFGWTGE